MKRYLIITVLAALVAGVAALSGCANTIRPPAEIVEPRKMYLLDLGRHTRLALGVGGGAFVEYGYGEWRWYAKLEDQWWRVPPVILWPTQGTLGRREWRGAEAEQRMLQEYSGLEVLELPAERQRVAALADALDRAFRSRRDMLVHNEVYGLDFVPCDRGYWLFNNSNHAVKEWLETTGYEVSGTGMFANWKVEGADQP